MTNSLRKELEALPLELCLARAQNPESSEDVLRCLSEHHFWFVRDYVASNSSTPKDCLHKLLQDEDFRVRDEAQRNLDNRAYKRSALDERIKDASGRIAESVNETVPKEQDR